MKRTPWPSLCSLALLYVFACSGADKPLESPIDTNAPAVSRPVAPATDEAADRDAGIQARIAAFDQRLEAKRKELGIPGLSLVIVKDDRVVLLVGHGLRDVERGLPVDPDTHFAIGSTTKAFTAMLALMAQEAGVLSLDDSPKKCLPYFSLADEDADAAITIRHLLTHTSGLARTDIGWISGKLNKDEVIRMAGQAKPVAKLGEEFHYQNIMYLAAGECVAQAMNKSYAELLRERIFEPVGMRTANVSVELTKTLPTRAIGYGQFGADKELRPVPMRPLDNIAPAGAINASARDMGQWLRLLLGRGQIDGKRLITEASFEAMTRSYITMAPDLGYGLGWMLSTIDGQRIITHGGGIDGFVTLVTLVPEQGLAFGLFTNIQNGDIHGYVSNEVLGLFAEDPRADATAKAGANDDGGYRPESEAGEYGILGGMRMRVSWRDGGLHLHVPNQPEYPLERVQGRRYRLGAPAPAGFFVTFAEREDAGSDAASGRVTEMRLQQPGIEVVLVRLTPAMLEAAKNARPPAELVPLLGTYRMKSGALEVRLEVREGRVSAILAGRQPMPLVPAGTDRFLLDGLPESFHITATRDDKGALVGLVLVQPNARLELERVGGASAPSIGVDEMEKRVARAHGSARLAKKKTLRLEARIELLEQGLTARSTLVRRAPDVFDEELILVGMGKEVGRIRTGTDGQRVWRHIDFLPTEDPRGAEKAALILHGVFDPHTGWRERFATVQVTGTSTVRDVPATVVEFTHESGVVITEYYATDSHMLLQRTTMVPGEESGASVTSEVFLDYRKVGGVMVPHRIETRGPLGEMVTTVSKVTWNARVPDTAFQP